MLQVVAEGQSDADRPVEINQEGGERERGRERVRQAEIQFAGVSTNHIRNVAVNRLPGQ